MKRLFWLGLGIAVGALVVRQVARAAHAYSPAGLADTARNSTAGAWGSVQDFTGRAKQWVGDFTADVREGMAEREAQIHAAFAHGESLAELDPTEDEFAANDPYDDEPDYFDEFYGEDDRTR
ncbi:MAG TPA: hypothetical protein VH561_16585 [Micromonosporaceae bacterium]|jgi:hypothetical protein